MRGWIVRDDLDKCIEYTPREGARILRYWSRYTQVGAYTRKCTGCVPTQRVSFRKVSARGAVDGTIHDTARRPRPRPRARERGPYCRRQTGTARRTQTPKGMPCGRYTARTREEGRSHSPEPSRNGLKPPSASHPTGAPPAFCASRTLLGRSDRTPAQSNKSNGSHCNHPWSSAWCVLWWAPAPTRVMP